MADITKFTDDFTGTAGAGWSGNWAASATSGAVNLDGSGRGRLSLTNVSTVANAYAYSYTSVVDGEILFAINAPSSTGDQYLFGFVNGITGIPDSASLTGDDWVFTNGVVVSGITAGAGSLGVWISGSKTDVTISTGNFSSATKRWVRMRKVGTNVKIRTWNDGSAEPGTWNAADVTITDPGVAMAAFVATDNRDSGGSSNMYIDDFTLTEVVSSVSVTASGVTPATGNGTMPGGFHPVDRTVSAPVATATALMRDAGVPKSQTAVAIADGDGVGSFQTNTLSGAGNGFSVKFASVSLPSDAVVTRVLFQFEVSSISGAQTLSIHRATADWTEGPFAEAPSYDATVLDSASLNGAGVKQVDVTNLWNSWSTNPDYGLVARGALSIVSREGAIDIPGVAPALVVEYLSDGLAAIAAPAGTASGVMLEPSFTNVTNKTVVATVSTASGLAVDASVSVTRAPVINAEPFVASGAMPVGSGFSVPTLVSAGVATGSALALDPTVTKERNARINAPALSGSGVEPQALLNINGAEVNPDLANDPYYAEMVGTTDADDFWYRLDESSGSVVHDARGDAAKAADLVGTYNFGVYGPESRKSIHFTDGYFKRTGALADDSDTDTFAFEVVLRTTDGNGMLAYGLDRANPLVEVGPIPTFRNSIYLKNGKVSTNWNYAGRTDSAFELSGVTNVADGQWHHIVVAFNYGPENNLDSGLRIYIDGKLDIRRRRDVVPGLWASPDSYFGMPDAWRAESILYPWQKNFNGDVMEVAFRYKDWLVQDQVIELYYDVFGIVPVRVQPATAVGVMPDAVGKGNKQRALVLYTKWNAQGLFGRIGDEGYSPSGYSDVAPDEFDHDINLGRVYEPNEHPWEELAGYRVVGVPIMREDYDVLAGPYRDPVTDLPRLLNLQEDLDMNEFDIIVFRNWPDEGIDRDQAFGNRGYSNDAIADFLASVKQAVVDGAGLEITNVALAASLGLITGAQAIPYIYDRNADGTESDFRAAVVNPWAEDVIGEPFYDMHANNWHRVVASIDKLTFVQDDEEKITEIYMTRNQTNGADGNLPTTWGYKTVLGPYQIGDVIMSPTTFLNRLYNYNVTPTTADVMWDRKFWAITPNGLPSGTPVYKFAATMYQGETEVPNPYAEYIGAAVLQPGDSWGGTPIAGKVFMNFAENPQRSDDMITLTRQIVPPNEEISNPKQWEDAEKREWDYTYNRVTYAATGDPFGKDRLVKVPSEPQADPSGDGEQTHEGDYYAVVFGKGIVGIDIIERYETEPIIVLSWALRGLLWLGVKEFVPSGSVNVRPTVATATADLPMPKVVGERSTTVSAEAAIALGVLVSPDEVEDPDAIVLTFPATGSGTMTGYGKTLAVGPFEGSGVMVDNFDLISASGEHVVVFLHRLKEVEIYLMEGNK